MSDTTQPQIDEFEMLKERAKMLGIKVGNSGVDALRKKVQDKLEGKDEEPEQTPEPVPNMFATQVAPPKIKTKAEIEQETRDRVKREALRLVRVRVANMNPSKSDLPGELITVANRYMGAVTKFIPFGEATDGGYHIPHVIYEELKGRKYQQIRTRKVNGQDKVETRLVPEYSIEILNPLTSDELKELALKQAAAERVGM